MINNPFFLFPGQGAQYQGMALDLLEPSFKCGGGEKLKHLFSMASDIFGKDMIALLRDSSPEVLKRTDLSQPAITLANLAAAACLTENGLEPAGCAGFSLGEYAALVVTGVISEEDCFSLVTARGKAMQAAIDKIAGGKESAGANIGAAAGASGAGMAAVIGLAPEKVEALVAEWKAGKDSALAELYAANINSPRQTVVSGSAAALAEAEKLFAAAGARRFMRLEVAGPFHSPFMARAAEEFGPFLDKITFNDPRIPFYSNVTGKRVFSGGEAKKLALLQITSAVRWVDEEEAINAEKDAPVGGIGACFEAGPGNVLERLWRDSGSEIPCHAAGTAADISAIFADGNKTC